jgi:hypothetical protein
VDFWPELTKARMLVSWDLTQGKARAMCVGSGMNAITQPVSAADAKR